jgi:hypothetical protein
MKLNMKSIFKNAIIVMGFAVIVVSCEGDVNSLGIDFLGIDVDNVIKSEEFTAITFSTALNPVQSNGFTSQPFGVYDDPVYGMSTHDFVTQLRLATVNPSFGTTSVLDSVVITIPLHATIATIAGENRTYTLDSVYNGTEKTKLRIYENNYFLNTFDPTDLTQAPRYFSDLGPTIDANKGQLLHENLEFKPLKREVRLIASDALGNKISNPNPNPDGTDLFIVTSREPPAYRAVLARANDSRITYWQNKIFNQEGSANLRTSGAFQNYFRGLYFKTLNTASDVAGEKGNLTHFNLNGASIIMYYTTMIQDITGNTTGLVPVQSSFKILLANNKVNLIRQEFKPAILASLQSSGNTITGDPSIFLKGGSGSMGFVDLFGPDIDLDSAGEADQLTALKARSLIINDATLTFFVDQTQVTSGRTEPERIVIYDVDNAVVLADFAVPTANGVAAVSANTTHLGRLVRETPRDVTTSGVSYTLRITRHITQILAGTRENVRLGIAVSQNVNVVGELPRVQNRNAPNPITVDKIFLGTAISHEGTVLHGSNSPDISKRPVFKIFYTEPN